MENDKAKKKPHPKLSQDKLKELKSMLLAKMGEIQGDVAGLKEEGLSNWSFSSLQISRAIRAFNPWPVCYTSAQGQTIRLWQGHRVTEQQTSAPAGMIIKADKQGLWIATGDGGVIAIDTLQLPNGKALAFNDVLNSRKELFQVGTSLGNPA